MSAPCGTLHRLPSLSYAFRAVLLQWAVILFASMVLVGVVLFCRIPWLARGSGIPPAEVALRCLDPHQGDPFYLIEGYAEAVRKAAIPWKNGHDISSIVTVRTPEGGYNHTAYS